MQKIAMEPLAFHLYKQRALTSKIDIISRNTIKRHKILKNLLEEANKDKVRHRMNVISKKYLDTKELSKIELRLK